MKSLSRLPVFGALALGLAALLPASLLATPIQWDGNNSGSWTDATNWNPDTTIDNSGTQDLVIATSGNGTYITTLKTSDGANAFSIRSLSIDDTAALLHNSSVGLRIAATNIASSSNSTTLTFSTPGINIISAANGATVSLNATTSTGTGSPSMTINLGYSGAGTLQVDGTSKLLINAASTTISGTGGLIKDGAGSLTLSGNHTYTGGFTLQAGTLVLTSSGARTGDNTAVANSAFGTGTLTLNGGTVLSSGAAGGGTSGRTIYSSIILNGDVAMTNAATGNISLSTSAGQSTVLAGNSNLNVGGNVIYDQSISGNYSLTKTGAGTLALNGTNTFTGLNINAGTVNVDSVTALGANVSNPSSVVLNGGTLAFASGSDTSASSNRGFQIGSGNGTIDLSSGRNVTLLGNITDVAGQHGMLTKTGAGTLTLSGANSYSGSTTVQGGALAGDATSLQGAIVLNNASSVTFNQTSDGTYAGSLSGNGSFTKLGAATLIVSNSSAHTGPNNVAEGALILQDAVFGGNGSAGLVVQSGAKLAGSGIIRGDTVLNEGSFLSMDTYTGGVVSNVIGKISFNNNLDLSGIAAFSTSPVTIPTPFGAPLAFDLGSSNYSDQIVVYGTLDIGNGLLDFADFSFTTAASLHDATYTLFSAPNDVIAGSLGTNLVRDFGDGFTGTLSLTDHAVQLTLVGAPIPEPSTYAALLGGIVALAAVYRRRRAR